MLAASSFDDILAITLYSVFSSISIDSVLAEYKDLDPKVVAAKAAAKKAAGKPKRLATLMGKFKQGKGNPAGKDMSLRGKLRSMTLAKLKKTRAKNR